MDNAEKARSDVVAELKAIGVSRGVMVTMAKNGQLLKVRCEVPKCYGDEGRGFPKAAPPNSDWSPTVDHYPVLKSWGGHKVPSNVRLAHKFCNGEDFAWRNRVARALDEGKPLQAIADELTRAGIKVPSNAGRWTAASVRWMFVTS